MGLAVNVGSGVLVGAVVAVGGMGVSLGVLVAVGGIAVAIGSVGTIVIPGKGVNDGVARGVTFGTHRISPGRMVAPLLRQLTANISFSVVK